MGSSSRSKTGSTTAQEEKAANSVKKGQKPLFKLVQILQSQLDLAQYLPRSAKMVRRAAEISFSDQSLMREHPWD
jgi:hypothetical protein